MIDRRPCQYGGRTGIVGRDSTTTLELTTLVLSLFQCQRVAFFLCLASTLFRCQEISCRLREALTRLVFP